MAAPYALTGPIGSAAVLGLIVLQEDETIEQDFRRLFSARDIALYVSRIPSGADVTPDTLAEMEAALPQAVGLFPSGLSFSAVGYACTSGATVIGPARVAELVQGSAQAGDVTNPMSATLAALEHLGARKVALVSPYVAEVSAPMRALMAAHGIDVARFSSFEEKQEQRVARIDPASIYQAALAAAQDGADAVFLSCTNLRTLDIIEPLEEALGIPVVSSNQALAWHMARLSGVAAGPVGQLMV